MNWYNVVFQALFSTKSPRKFGIEKELTLQEYLENESLSHVSVYLIFKIKYFRFLISCHFLSYKNRFTK